MESGDKGNPSFFCNWRLLLLHCCIDIWLCCSCVSDLFRFLDIVPKFVFDVLSQVKY